MASLAELRRLTEEQKSEIQVAFAALDPNLHNT